MKTTWQRIVALGMALLMATIVVSCGQKDKEGSSASGDSPTTSVAEEVPVDLGGYEFKIVDYNANRWQPEPGQKVSDKIISIIDDVQTTFNCKITFERVTPETIFDKVQPEVLAGQKYADLIVTTEWAYGRLLGADLMADLKSINTLNLNNPWWNKKVMEATTINGKTLACAGGFTSHVGNTWVMYYNNRIWQELGYPDPYELVNKGEWTYDKFAELAKGAMRDNDGNGVVDSGDDRWGLVTPLGDYARAMFLGMGGQYYSIDANGKVVMACNNEKTYAIFQKMDKLIKQDKSTWLPVKPDISNCANMFMEGKSLFLGYMVGYSKLRDMEDDFGVMPIPKGSKEADYVNVVDHNAPIFGVTSTNTNKRETGIIIEAIGRRYKEIQQISMDDWADTLWRMDQDDAIIRNHVMTKGGYDIALIVQGLRKPVSSIFSSIFSSGSSDLASEMQAMQPAVEASIQDIFYSGKKNSSSST